MEVVGAERRRGSRNRKRYKRDGGGSMLRIHGKQVYKQAQWRNSIIRGNIRVEKSGERLDDFS